MCALLGVEVCHRGHSGLLLQSLEDLYLKSEGRLQNIVTLCVIH